MVLQQAVDQPLQIHGSGIERRAVTLRHVEIEHVLDQLLQLNGIARQDLEDLCLRGV